MKIAFLAMTPSGTLGRVFGVIMEWINAGAYKAALEILSVDSDERILEIGFGTGKLAELLLESNSRIRVAGIDPTETMVNVTRSRHGVRIAGTRTEFRQGDASALPWPSESFDAVVAIHSFQFWSDPEESLREISRILTISGRILLILRDHAKRSVNWLPNRLSRSASEVDDTILLLKHSGFVVRQYPDIGHSHALLATQKA